MDMVINHGLVNSVVAPAKVVTGNYLAYAKLTKAQRAFVAADLVTGAAQLVQPTVLDAAWLASVNPTYAHYALRHSEQERFLIEKGILPLAPTVPAMKALPAPVDPVRQLADIVGVLGVGGTLDALTAIEQHAIA
jgi:hypothetical protein